jgi:membrane protease YdiL (CAAX protease family)
MKNSLISILKNPFILAYVGLYVLFLVLLHSVEGFDITEPVFVFLVVGIGFSAIAWWTTKGVTPLTFSIKQPASECGLLTFCLVIVMIFITWGLNIVESSIHTEPLKSLVILTGKLAVFVVVPLLLFRWLWKYTLRDFISVSADWRRPLRVVVWMSLVLILFQFVFGRGLSEIQQSGLGGWSLAAGIPFVYLWLILEVGLVEEFFFRALLQSRLAALFKSETAGVVLMSLLFGLAHAPGMYFRTVKTLEVLGPHPSLLMAIGHSIVITSVTGFFLGVLWVRTKNLTVLILVHAAGDLVPNIASILKAWIL